MGKFSSTLKQNRHMPTTRRPQELECRFRVVLVDEQLYRRSSCTAPAWRSALHCRTATLLRDICCVSDGRYVREVQWCDATITCFCTHYTHLTRTWR
jgi:hypothetical protein